VIIVERVYPEIQIHAQASGRHSTVNPPLATTPKDLRNLYLPDVGCVWFCYDWDQEELRILACEAGDEVLIRSFQQRLDIHTQNTCEIFAYPYPPNLVDPHTSPECASWRLIYDWQGKDDRRRRFGKRRVFKLVYRGEVNSYTPGAAELGLDKQKLALVSNRWLLAHPTIPSYWRAIDKLVADQRKGFVRTWAGRRRPLSALGPKAGREAANHPMQGGGVDIYNLTLIQVSEEVKCVDFAYGMHDSHKWQMKRDLFESPLGQEFCNHIARIAQQPRTINGISMPFTANFSWIDDTGVENEWQQAA